MQEWLLNAKYCQAVQLDNIISFHGVECVERKRQHDCSLVASEFLCVLIYPCPQLILDCVCSVFVNILGSCCPTTPPFSSCSCTIGHAPFFLLVCNLLFAQISIHFSLLQVSYLSLSNQSRFYDIFTFLHSL